MRSLRRNPSLLEQHMKYTATGDVFVRRFVYGSGHVNASPTPGDKTESLVVYSTKGIRTDRNSTPSRFSRHGYTPGEKPCVAFLGTIADSSTNVKGFSAGIRVCTSRFSKKYRINIGCSYRFLVLQTPLPISWSWIRVLLSPFQIM